MAAIKSKMIIDWRTLKRVHIIGIGGIGISALARMFLHQGKTVTGSDQASSPITIELEKLGGEVRIGHKPENVPTNADLVVYTNAATDDNPELAEARKRGVNCLSYPEALGEVSREKFTIAVAGTHGKTTTTAMIAEIMITAGLSPTVIVGSLLKSSGSNFVPGDGKYLVVEADEYKRAFLNLNPQILVITNIDLDHLDYFKNLEDIQDAFANLAGKILPSGTVICQNRDTHLRPVLSRARCHIRDFSLIRPPKDFLSLPGEHNRLNARAALMAAAVLKINRSKALSALKDFKGTWRRFEYKGKTPSGALVYDDYAHNPAKLRAIIAAAKEKFPRNKIIIVFQPHLYSRTKLLLDDFSKSFAGADEVLLVDIYPARESFDSSIHARDLANATRQQGVKIEYLPDFSTAVDYLKNHTGLGDVVFTVGAGDVWQIGDRLLQ